MSETRTALISCSDKRGLGPLARALEDMGWRIISTGGTAEHLAGAGVDVINISDITGHPSLLGGRVKTLHPAIHSGILARRDRPEDMQQLRDMRYEPIDMVVVNLYPLEETASGGAGEGEVLENIDIGGPTLLRAAAKNFPSVISVVRPDDYDNVVQNLQECGDVDQQTRRALAAAVFRHVSRYDSLISVYLSGGSEALLGYPDEMTIPLRHRMTLRYGENPHQTAAFYEVPGGSSLSLARLRQHSGPPLSFNNYCDVDVAVSVAADFSAPLVCAIKHNIPCGVAASDSPRLAFERAYEADPVSIFGGVVSVNRPVDLELVQCIVQRELFLEALVAPEYTDEALERLQKRKKLRVLQLDALAGYRSSSEDLELDRVEGRFVRGGMLINSRDEGFRLSSCWEVVGSSEPEESIWPDMEFAWRVAKYVKSNAIVVARDGVSWGIGAGQVNRVGSAEIALDSAGDRCEGAVMASDGMLPFPDVAELAAERGIRALVQPGGSIRDDESIEVADRAGMVMIFTGRRHFRH